MMLHRKIIVITLLLFLGGGLFVQAQTRVSGQVIDEQGEIINPKNILQQKYESYDDEILPELCILLLIGRFDEIYGGIKQKAERYGERAIHAPMEVISYIIASYKWGSLFDNMDKSIVRDEVNAQMKLVKTLQTPRLFSLEDRNIFRNK